MENNLYYTPTIEEFHVGFEYEYNSSDKKHWTTCIIDKRDMTSSNMDWCSPNWIEDVFNQIETNGVRVKTLDQSDIESLGWEEGTYNTIKGFIKNDKLLTINYNYKTGPVVDISYFPMFKKQGLSRIFIGTIKNKSELIKLMQQLNIK